jgi:hypothetical protein
MAYLQSGDGVTHIAPPRLHWAWVLLLSLLSLGFFGMIWLVVQAAWIRKVRGTGFAYHLALIHCSSLPLLAFTLAATGVGINSPALANIISVFRFFTFALYLLTVFALRAELIEKPIFMPLSRLWAVLLGPVYFQHYLTTFEFGKYDWRARGERLAAVVMRK